MLTVEVTLRRTRVLGGPFGCAEAAGAMFDSICATKPPASVDGASGAMAGVPVRRGSLRRVKLVGLARHATDENAQ